MMGYSKQEALLTLLALVIIADKRVLSYEIMTFVKSASMISNTLEELDSITGGKALIWFEDNEKRLKDVLEAENFDAFLEEIFTPLEPLSQKDLIFSKMLEIAKSDDEFHVSEKALTVLTARRWGLAIDADLNAIAS